MKKESNTQGYSYIDVNIVEDEYDCENACIEIISNENPKESLFNFISFSHDGAIHETAEFNPVGYSPIKTDVNQLASALYFNQKYLRIIIEKTSAAEGSVYFERKTLQNNYNCKLNPKNLKWSPTRGENKLPDDFQQIFEPILGRLLTKMSPANELNNSKENSEIV